MMAGEQPSLDTIFCAAVEFASPGDRAAYLAAACGDDGDLRRQAERLVDAHFRAGSFLEDPAQGAGDTAALAPPTPTPTPADLSGATLGPYHLLEPLGEGGMGTVWLARQTEPIQRTVAVKLVKAGMDSSQVLARFEAERQALALMDHPNIAKVHDAGTLPDGRP